MTTKRFPLMATILAAALSFGAITSTAHAQQPNQNGRSAQGALALGGLFNSLVNLQNVQVQAQVQNTLNNLLQSSDIRVLNLNNVLDGSQINVLSDILRNSTVLSGITVTLQNILNNSANNNTILQNFLNQNNVALSDLVAIDVLSGRVTLITLNQPR